MYGDEPPELYTKVDGELIDGGALLVFRSDWMTLGEDKNGEKPIYSHFDEESGDNFASIFTYFCAPEKYRERIKEDVPPEAKL